MPSIAVPPVLSSPQSKPAPLVSTMGSHGMAVESVTTDHSPETTTDGVPGEVLP